MPSPFLRQVQSNPPVLDGLVKRRLVAEAGNDPVAVVARTIAVQIAIDRHQNLSGIAPSPGQDGLGKVTINPALFFAHQRRTMFKVEQRVFNRRRIIPTQCRPQFFRGLFLVSM